MTIAAKIAQVFVEDGAFSFSNLPFKRGNELDYARLMALLHERFPEASREDIEAGLALGIRVILLDLGAAEADRS